MSLPDFIKDSQSSVMPSSTDGTMDDLVEANNYGFKVLREKHAPLQRKNTVLRLNASWYKEELREIKRKYQKDYGAERS